MITFFLHFVTSFFSKKVQTNSYALIGYSLVRNYAVISAMFVMLLLEITRPPLLWFSLRRKLVFSSASTLSEDEEKTIESEKWREGGRKRKEKGAN